MTDNALETCLRYIAKDDSILLSSDAVNSLLQPKWLERLSSFHIMVLQDDIVARGLSQRFVLLQAQPHKSVFDIIDYAQFVEQSLLHNKVITW